MGLVYWAPCLGKLKNQGISSAQTTATSFSADAGGKIGKCIKVTSGIDTGLPGASWDINQNSITMMGWFKLPETEIRTLVNSFTDWDSIHQNMRGVLLGNNSYGGLSLHLVTNTIYGGSFSTVNVMASIRSGSSLIETVAIEVPFDKWTHIAGVFDIDTKVAKVYINGVLQRTASIVNPLANDVPMRNFYICNNQVDGGNGPARYFPFYCNDIRVYTKALKDEQIRKISQGLTLHYSLSNRGFGGDNIIKNSWPEERSYTYPSSSYSDKFSPITTIVPSASKYTLSFYAKSTVNGDKIRTHYYSPNTTTTCVSSQGITKTASDGNMDFTLSTSWKRYWVTYTQNETTAVKHVICPRLLSGQGTGTVSIKGIKFEEGEKATAWIPNSADALYSSLQLGSTTELDCSGYQYNGTKNGTFVNAESPINQGCYVFNGTDSWIRTTANTQHIGTGDFTISAWINLEASNKTYQPVISNKTTGAASVGCAIYFNHSQNKFLWSSADGSGATEIWTVNTFADIYDQWTHVVMVRNSSDAKKGYFYINGVRQELASVPAIRNISTTHELVIGALYTDHVNYRWTGKISDVRMYATALSEDAIKELYMMGGGVV